MWYQEIAVRLQEIGMLDLILPFMLIFVVVFAIMQRSKILGEESRKFNVIVALVMGLLVVLPHAIYGQPGGTAELSLSVGGKALPDVVNIINNALPSISVWLIAILMVMLLLGMFGVEALDIRGKGIFPWILIAVVLIVLYVFAISANWLQSPGWLDWLNDRTNQAVLMILLVFGLVVWYVTSSEEEETNKPGVFDMLRELGAAKPGKPRKSH
jgi:hypothetical protein